MQQTYLLLDHNKITSYIQNVALVLLTIGMAFSTFFRQILTSLLKFVKKKRSVNEFLRS